MSFLPAPKLAAPQVIEAPKPTTENKDRKVQEDRMRLLKKKGRGSTILASRTSGSGKTLLGG